MRAFLLLVHLLEYRTLGSQPKRVDSLESTSPPLVYPDCHSMPSPLPPCSLNYQKPSWFHSSFQGFTLACAGTPRELAPRNRFRSLGHHPFLILTQGFFVFFVFFLLCYLPSSAVRNIFYILSRVLFVCFSEYFAVFSKKIGPDYLIYYLH